MMMWEDSWQEVTAGGSNHCEGELKPSKLMDQDDIEAYDGLRAGDGGI